MDKTEKNKNLIRKNILRKIKKQAKGITLIALVVTIIVLLILAGIALNLTIGENGLFTRAENAANTWKLAEQNEQNTMDSLASWIDETIGNNNDNKDNNNKPLADITGDETTNTVTQDEYGNPITIPAGFKVVNPDDDVTKGIVIEDVSANGEDSTTEGSQFVWIPVGDIYTSLEHTEENKKTIILGRYTFDTTGAETLVQSAENWNQEITISTYYKELATSNYGNATAKNLEDFISKVIKSGGYYIGKYEARTIVSRTESTEDSELTPITVKQDDYVYNYVTQLQAANLSQEMYKEKNFESDLLNSYAWDTAIVFIQSFSGQTNYANQKSLNTNFLSKGTSNDNPCNIYDLASNLWEWTTELNFVGFPCIYRGGLYLRQQRLYCSTQQP